MTMLIAGLILFLGSHSVSIVNAGWRDRMVASMGELPWKLAYGVVALIGLVLIVQGYGAARMAPTILYVPPLWLSHVSLLLMVFVFPLLLAAYLPGYIQRATKHPMLVATKVWALAHLLANGTLADVVLFGSFLAWAVVDRISVKRRATAPPVAGKPSIVNDIIAVVGGLGLYVLFVTWAHLYLFGVAPVG